jgi:hypothetical protein
MSFLDDFLADTKAELKRRFTYHPPKPEQVKKYEGIRSIGLAVSELITFFCPPCREREEALKCVDAMVMWTNAAIARRT